MHRRAAQQVVYRSLAPGWGGGRRLAVYGFLTCLEVGLTCGGFSAWVRPGPWVVRIHRRPVAVLTARWAT